MIRVIILCLLSLGVLTASPIHEELAVLARKRAAVSTYNPSASAQSWWDASDTATITGFPTATAIADKAGADDLTINGNPQTGTRLTNGLNSIDFDGTGDYMVRATYSTAASFTVVCAVVIDSISSTAQSIVSMDAGSNDWQLEAN